MELHKLEDDLWVIDDLVRLPGGLRMAARSTLARLPDGGLALISPLPGLVSLADAISALGPVRAIIAPNLMHHLGIAEARARFPEARVFARPGLSRKRPDLTGLEPLGGAPDPGWAGALDQLEIGGMPKLDEVVFFHRRSRTLVLFDLCFHLTAPEQIGNTTVFRWMLQLNQAWGRFGPSRYARSLMKDKAAVRASVDRVLGWQPERIVPGHGTVVARDGTARLREAFAFLPG